MGSWNFGEQAKGRFDRWLRDYPRATPIGVFLLALLLVGISAWSVELAGERTRQADTAIQASEIAAAIERQAAANNAYFQATSALFVGAQAVSPDFFHQFVEQLRLNYDLTGVVALGWSETVPRHHIPDLTRRMAAQGYADFHLHPASSGTSGTVNVITMLEPRTPRNMGLIGYDMSSEARRTEAMERARRTNSIAATEPLTLLIDEGVTRAPSFVVYVPVTSLGGSPVFKGFVYGAIRIPDFVRSALKARSPASGRIEIYATGRHGRQQVFSSGETTMLLGTPVEQRLAVFDQQWLLRYSPPGQHVFYPLTLVVLVGGASFSLLLLAYILLVQRRNEDLHLLITAQGEREAERAAFVRELNHRVKNTLANVTSIISLTRRNATNIESFSGDLLERVRALAASHSLLDGAQWGPTDLRALVEAQIGQAGGLARRVTVDGPNLLISPNDALTVGLALHELLTNATRYGSLSIEEGQVTISWRVEVATDTVAVTWKEHNGPTITPPERRGFGLNLIERALAHELGQPITIEFPPSGLRCHFSVSLRKPRPFRLRG
ncbi:MAG TPA: CHASE domain-containing protein [Sphingobium sp.]|nr:CHASE domain-containing protein [Sphingobium sp.]